MGRSNPSGREKSIPWRVLVACFVFLAFSTSGSSHDSYDAGEVSGLVERAGSTRPNWTPITGGLPSLGEHYDVTFGDVNNDGKLDVAVSTATGLIHVYVGDGAGNFVEESSGLPATGTAYELVLADFNNDGNLDIAGDERIFLGNGGKGGSMVWTFDSYVGPWFAASAADLNLDGRMDLVTGSDNGVHVYTGDGGVGGNIIWTDSSNGLPTLGTFWKPVVGDINHDGKPDIICADRSNGLKVWIGNGGTGPLAQWTDVTPGSGLPESQSYASVDIGDVNHDGNLDIVSTAYYSANGVRVWLGNGGEGGSILWSESSNGLDTTNSRYLGVKLSDINNDGNLDIFAARYDVNGGLRVWLGNGGIGGSMNWNEDSAGLPTGSYIDVDAGDYNNDGKVDFVAGSSSGVEIWQNDRPDFSVSSYTSASINLPTTNTWADVQFADVDHDGKLDLGFTSFQGQDLGIRVFLGDGTGIWTDSSSGLPTTGSFNSLRFGDIDHDGAIDIISAQDGGGGNNGIHAYKGDGTGSWTEMPLVSSRGGAGLELADINHDGNLDVITGYYENNWGPMIYLGNGDFTWSADVGPIGETLNVDDVAVADVNHDGHLDIAASSMNNAGIQLWTGDGTGMPGGWTRNDTGLPTSQVWLGLDFADVNHDGHPDLVAAGYAPSPGPGLRVWLGNGGVGGSMIWTPASSGLPATGRFGGVEFGDTNLDGNMDLIFASSDPAIPTGVGYMRGNGGAGGNLVWTDPGVSGIPATGRFWGVSFGDMNNDGVTDLAVTGVNGVEVYMQGESPAIIPSILISYPDGGQNWTGNTQHTIWWNLSDDSPLTDLIVYLNYSYGSGSYTGRIAGPISGTLNPNSYSWTTPNINADDLLINATVIDPDGLQSWSEVFVSDIDSRPPGVVFNLPADGAVNVPVDQPLIIQFNDSMRRDSVISAISVIPNPGGWSWSWTSSNYLDDNLTGSHNPFSYGQVYIVNIMQSASDSSSPGNTLLSPLSFSFTTEIPNTPPTVSLESPKSGMSWTGDTNHSILFTVNDSEDSLSSILVWVNYSMTGNPPWFPIVGPITADSGPVLWRVPLTNTSTAYVRVEALDPQGGFGADISGPFEIDSTDPYITMVSPQDGDQEVPTNALIQAFWSEGMNLSLTNTSFSLRDNSTWTLVSGEITWTGSDVFSFRPDFDLSPGTWYTANFTTLATDDSDPGNMMEVPYTWSFRTALVPDRTPPIIENVTENPSPVEVFFTINISASIYDDFNLQGVWIEFTPPFGPTLNTTMDYSGEIFFKATSWGALGTYHYTIWTVDGTSNWNSFDGEFDVVDTSPPTIDNVRVVPSEIEAGGEVNISAMVSDNYLLEGVWIVIRYPDMTSLNLSVDLGEFYFSQEYMRVGSYSFTIWATDISGNWATSSGSFQVLSPTTHMMYVIISLPSNGTEVRAGEVLVVEGWLREVGTERGIEGEVLSMRLESLDGDMIGEERWIVSRSEGRVFEAIAIPDQIDECRDLILILSSNQTNISKAEVTLKLVGCQEGHPASWPFLALIIIIGIVLAILFLMLLTRKRKGEGHPPETPDKIDDDKLI